MRKWFKQTASRRACYLVVLALLAPAGCNGRLGKMVPVSGKITVNGKPVPSGQVVYVPEKNVGDAIISGKIDNGTYTIETNGKVGAPLGRYKIFVTTSMPGTKEQGVSINTRYTSANSSGLTAEVVENPGPDAYDLKLTK